MVFIVGGMDGDLEALSMVVFDTRDCTLDVVGIDRLGDLFPAGFEESTASEMGGKVGGVFTCMLFDGATLLCMCIRRLARSFSLRNESCF